MPDPGTTIMVAAEEVMGGGVAVGVAKDQEAVRAAVAVVVAGRRQ